MTDEHRSTHPQESRSGSEEIIHELSRMEDGSVWDREGSDMFLNFALTLKNLSTGILDSAKVG